MAVDERLSKAALVSGLREEYEKLKRSLDADCLDAIEKWNEKKDNYAGEYFTYKVRDKEIKVKNHTESLSHSKIPKIGVPRYQSWATYCSGNCRKMYLVNSHIPQAFILLSVKAKILHACLLVKAVLNAQIKDFTM